MTHIAIQEARDGNVVTWLEHVSDAQYGTAPRADYAANRLEWIKMKRTVLYGPGAVRFEEAAS